MEKKLGVEIEFSGVRRKDVVNALENFFQVKSEEVISGTTDDKYAYHRVKDMNDDTWLVVRDRSIRPEKFIDKDFNKVCIDDTEYMCELVSPPLSSKSLPLLFSIVDIIRGIGGLTNETCGIHVHVDKPDDLGDCVLLYNRFLVEQDSILDKFKVNDERLDKYCRKLNSDKPLTDEVDSLESLVKSIFKSNLSESEKLRTVRYFGLNMYSLLAHGTIEFRIFNSSLNRVDIAVILDWVLHFMYTAEDYNCYIPILGSILMNEIKSEA